MKRTLLRLISLLLMLCLFTPSSLAASAEDAPMVVQDINIRFLFVLDGEICAITYGDTMFQQSGDGWLVRGGLNDGIWGVDLAGEALWLLCRKEGNANAWYEISRAVLDDQGNLTGTEAPLEVVWDLDAENWPSIYGFVVEDDAAYILASNKSWSAQDLYRVDLSSGKGTIIFSDPLDAMTRYKDGQLLLKRFDWDLCDDNGNTLPPEILAFDPASGEAVSIGFMGSHDNGGMLYDPETDGVYFSDESYVYRAAGDTPQTVGYLAMGGSSSGKAVMREGRYILDGYRGMVSATVDPSLLPQRTLRVNRNYLIDDQVLAFAMLHPEIAIESTDRPYSNLEEFSRVMQSDNAPDVFTQELNRDFITLRDRKYLIDLSASEILTDVVGRMASNITRDVLTGGQLFALPYGCDILIHGYYPNLLEELGLTVDDLPTSYEGLMAFIERWREEFFEDNEDMDLFEYCYNLRSFLFNELVDTQLRACQADGVLTLDTPAFRHLLARLEEITPIIDEVAPLRDDEDFYDRLALFTDMYTALIREYPFDERYGTLPLPLALDEQSDPVIGAYLSMLVINPYSQNADIAMELMEYIAEHLPITQRVTMMPEENGPIELANYDAELQRMRQQIALLETRLADITDGSGADLQDELQYLQYQLKDYEDNRWAMTTEEILWYRENIAPYLTFTTVSVSSSNTSEQLYKLRQRYLDGQASADEFIQRFEEIVWMMQQEQN